MQVPENEAYEHSEMLLYKALVLEEGGREPAALQLLHDKEVQRFTLLCQLRSCLLSVCLNGMPTQGTSLLMCCLDPGWQ